jgi:hypothetical protein
MESVGRIATCVVLCVCVFVSPSRGDESFRPQYDLLLAAAVDDADGQSYDLDLRIRPTRRWSLSAGAGTLDSSDDPTNLSAETFRAGIDFQGQWFAFGLSHDRFADSGEFVARSSGLRAALILGRTELALRAQQRQFDLAYTVTNFGTRSGREISFDADGYGIDVSYFGAAWSVYGSATQYDYETRFDQFVQLSRSPGIDRLPRLAGLVSSLLTQAKGTLDWSASIGADRSFGRHGLVADLTVLQDAIDQSTSRSAQISYRFDVSPRVNVAASLAKTTSDGYADTTSVGLTLGLRR